MNWNNPKLRLLNLDSKEKDLLNLLSEEYLSIKEVDEQYDVPRTTIKFTVDNLVERGFVVKKSFGKRFKYKSIRDHEIRKKVLDASNYLKYEDEDVSEVETDNFEVLRGTEMILKEYESIMREHPNQRLHAIQPIISSNIMHDAIGRENVKRMNKAIKENNLVLDALLEKNFYREFGKKHISGPGKKEYAETFTDRAADYTSLPVEKYTWETEIWIIGSTMLSIDWGGKRAVKVVDENLIKNMIGMYNLIKEFGKKINHSEEVGKILKTDDK